MPLPIDSVFELIAELNNPSEEPLGSRFIYAHIADALTGRSREEILVFFSDPQLRAQIIALDKNNRLRANVMAAFLEELAEVHQLEPPHWTAEISPLPDPFINAKSESLRTHLLISSSGPCKSRNIFIGKALTSRV